MVGLAWVNMIFKDQDEETLMLWALANWPGELIVNQIRKANDFPKPKDPEKEANTHSYFCETCRRGFIYNGHGCPLRCPHCGEPIDGDCG